MAVPKSSAGWDDSLYNVAPTSSPAGWDASIYTDISAEKNGIGYWDVLQLTRLQARVSVLMLRSWISTGKVLRYDHAELGTIV